MWSDPPDNWRNVPESRLLDRETIDQVRAAIERRPAKQREVVILRDVAGFDAGEVCTLPAISSANQRVRLHRGWPGRRRAAPGAAEGRADERVPEL